MIEPKLKTLAECQSEVAQKHRLGKSLVIGHKPTYFNEASEMYADQFRQSDAQRVYSTDDLKQRAIDLAHMLYNYERDNRGGYFATGANGQYVQTASDIYDEYFGDGDTRFCMIASEKSLAKDWDNKSDDEFGQTLMILGEITEDKKSPSKLKNDTKIEK